MRILAITFLLALLLGACGGDAIPPSTPTIQDSPRLSDPDFAATSTAAIQARIDEGERQIVDGLINLFPRSCVDKEGAFASAQSLLPQGSSEEVLKRANSIISVCKERGLWLGGD